MSIVIWAEVVVEVSPAEWEAAERNAVQAVQNVVGASGAMVESIIDTDGVPTTADS